VKRAFKKNISLIELQEKYFSFLYNRKHVKQKTQPHTKFIKTFFDGIINYIDYIKMLH